MTEPLIKYPFVNERDKKVPPDLDGKLIRDLIDVGWMSEKGLKWFGWDVNGWYAWTDSKGMIYRIRDLKRNEDGKRFEKEVKNIVRGDEPRDDLHANANQLYQHEFNLCVDCQLCPDRTAEPNDAEETTDNQGTKNEVDVIAPPWETFAGGNPPVHGNGTNYIPAVNYGGNGDNYVEYVPTSTDVSVTVTPGHIPETGRKPNEPVANTPEKKVIESPAVPPTKETVKGVAGGRGDLIVETENGPVKKYNPKIPKINNKIPEIPNRLLPFYQSKAQEINIPPPPIPIECDVNFKNLFSNLSKDYDNSQSVDLLLDFANRILPNRIKADKLSKLDIRINYSLLLPKTAFETDSNNTLFLNKGDFIRAFKNKYYFYSFITAITHEHIHGLQQTKLGLKGWDNHDEREVMANLFNIFSIELIEWIKRTYPGAIPDDYYYCFPTYTSIYELQSSLSYFFKHYNNLSERNKLKYKHFYEKAIILRNLHYDKFDFKKELSEFLKK